jgi:hypothetical protein
VSEAKGRTQEMVGEWERMGKDECTEGSKVRVRLLYAALTNAQTLPLIGGTVYYAGK